MVKMIGLIAIAGAGIVMFFTNCNQNVVTNLTSEMTNDLSVISSGFVPRSLDVAVQSNPCVGVTNFAICQSNSVAQYFKIAKSAADTVLSMAIAIGKSVGEIDDNNSGTSGDGKVSWTKTSSQVWSVLQRGVGGAIAIHITATGSGYNFKYNASVSETNPQNQQIEAIISFTDSNTWTVDFFVANNDCDPINVSAPSKMLIKLSKLASNTGVGLWKAKMMMYMPRWQTPGTAQPVLTCSTPAGVSEIAMYSDFIGNDTSTKAAVFLLPANLSVLPTNTGGLPTTVSFALPNFCNNFSTFCDGGGQPTTVLLASFPNNYCTIAGAKDVIWGDNCSDPVIGSGSYLGDSLWVPPGSLKTKVVTVPAIL